MAPDSSFTRDESTLSRSMGETTRRRVLRATVNLGVGAGLVWGTGYTSSDDTVSVVYAHARPSPGSDSLEERTKQVPADWYESLQKAFSVQRQLGRTDVSSLLASFVVPGTYDDPTVSMDVDAASESVGDKIAGVIGDIPVDVSVVEDLEPPEDDQRAPAAPFEVTSLDRRRIPGGVVCEAAEASGTLAPALYEDRGDGRYFATSNHVYGNQGTLETDHRGEPLSITHDDESREIGQVERGFPSADLVTASPLDDAVPASEIARAEPSTVVGQYTRVGLADLMARDEELEKFGARSGHTAGPILGVDGVTCYTADFCRTGQLRWGGSETMTSGDSGSVNYHPDPENPDEFLLVGGMNNARSWWPSADFSWGTAAYTVRSEYGLHF